MLILDRSTPPSWCNHLWKASPLNSIILEIYFQCKNFGVSTDFQTISKLTSMRDYGATCPQYTSENVFLHCLPHQTLLIIYRKYLVIYEGFLYNSFILYLQSEVKCCCCCCYLFWNWGLNPGLCKCEANTLQCATSQPKIMLLTS